MNHRQQNAMMMIHHHAEMNDLENTELDHNTIQTNGIMLILLVMV